MNKKNLFLVPFILSATIFTSAYAADCEGRLSEAKTRCPHSLLQCESHYIKSESTLGAQCAKKLHNGTMFCAPLLDRGCDIPTKNVY